ncbi:glycoside hydrolase family 43 protein [Salinimonas sediminis]|nr:glycoside hydrolase family 43 protein [Salinimonas sediminis]
MMSGLCILMVVVGLLAAPGLAHAQAINPFTAARDTAQPVTYTNPIIPGFYSDPSVVRVGDDYYLTTSTFEYFPALPIFHSRDLVNWQQIGHVVERPEQLPEGVDIYAPTLRFHDGTFYLITTNINRGGNVIMHAQNPAGPWSDAVWIDLPGIDPDLFFDDDGKVYSIGSDFELAQINPQTGEIISRSGPVWATTGGRYAEAPHLYKKDGWYYLLAAEGGTEEAHSVTIARSHKISGPYYSNPANPILTHVNRAGQQNPIQGVGHGDLVEDHTGRWWLLFHGYRTVIEGGVHHTLGRETMLAPVSWPAFGWPQINGNGTVTPTMQTATLPLKPIATAARSTDFTAPLGLAWNYVQYPAPERYRLDEQAGTLTLNATAGVLENPGSQPTFIGQRVTDPYFTATATLTFTPAAHEQAGLTLLNNGAHFDIMLVNVAGEINAQAILRFGEVEHRSKAVPLAGDTTNLVIKGRRDHYEFGVIEDNQYQKLETVSARYISSETVGGFTGTYIGLYTVSPHSLPTPAIYSKFTYTKDQESATVSDD